MTSEERKKVFSKFQLLLPRSYICLILFFIEVGFAAITTEGRHPIPPRYIINS